MTTIAFCFLLAVLINLPMFFHARHRRRLAEARLEIARVATEMEKIMLEGHVKLGDLCHDKIYQLVLESLYARTYCVPWNFWKKSPTHIIEMRKRFQDEIAQKTEIGKLLLRFARADLKAFKNNRPLGSMCFVLWVMIFAGGISVLLMALAMLLLGFLGVFTAVKAWKTFKKTWGNFIAESYIACNVEAV